MYYFVIAAITTAHVLLCVHIPYVVIYFWSQAHKHDMIILYPPVFPADTLSFPPNN